MLTSLLLALAAHATCPAWDGGLRAHPLAGAASSTLTFTWREVPACRAFSFDHYAVCWRSGELDTRPDAPEAPDEAGVVCNHTVEAARRTRLTDRVELSNHAYGVALFACADADCTSWYGDDGARVQRTTAGARTAKERWVVTGIDGLDDADRLVADNGASAAAGVVYPSPFMDADHLGIWYSTMAGGIQNIRYMRADSPTWGDWNRNGDGFTPPTEVLTSAVGGAFGYVTHPWVVAATDGPSPYVRLYAQVDDDNSPATGDAYSVWSVDSLDENGADFGITCSGTSCAVDGGTCAAGELCDWLDTSGDGGEALIEVGSVGDVLDAYITSAAHGYVLYDYLNDPDGTIDFSIESPSLLFTGSAESCYSPPDEIFMGTWDGAAWSIPMSGDGHATCPSTAVDDAHDPSALPLPDGTSKVYMQLGTDSYQVCYFDAATSWHDCEPIEVAFDDGTPLGNVDPLLAACSDNFGAFFSTVDGLYRQGSLLHVMGSPECFGEGSGGIVFAELRNG